VIDGMTLAEAGEIFAYWEHSPPSHLLLQAIAGLIGWAPRPATSGAPPLADIAAAAPPGLTVAPGADLGMPPPLDLVALRARNQARAAPIATRPTRTQD
jgi:hypothetical protein